MENPTITIPIDPETAQAYYSATSEEKRKMQSLLSFWLRELLQSQSPSLQQVLDKVGQQARAKGLTPKILNGILSSKS